MLDWCKEKVRFELAVVAMATRERPIMAAPTCGDEQGGSLGDDTLVAFLHFVSKEHFALIGRGAPCLI